MGGLHPPVNRKPDAIEPLTPEEQQALEIRWYEGRMLPYVEWILEFAGKHREEILRTAGPGASADQLVAVVKDLIVQRGTMHLAAELKDQMREMEKELWYSGEQDPRARAEIKQQWTTRHAAAWRRWRAVLASRPGLGIVPPAGFCAARCFAVRLDGGVRAAAVFPVASRARTEMSYATSWTACPRPRA